MLPLNEYYHSSQKGCHGNTSNIRINTDKGHGGNKYKHLDNIKAVLKNIAYIECNRCVNIYRIGVKTDNANTSGLNDRLEIVSELSPEYKQNLQRAARLF